MAGIDPHNPQDRDDGPWYRQGWAWFVLAPILVVIVAWIPFMTIAIKKSDDVVIDNYYREGRMYNMRLDQDRLARDWKVRGELLIDETVGEVLVNLSVDESKTTLPEGLILHMDHPVEADNDFELALRKVHNGRYVGELESRLQHRWYVRLEPVSDAVSAPEAASSTAASWRITGEMDLSQASRLMFGADE